MKLRTSLLLLTAILLLSVSACKKTKNSSFTLSYSVANNAVSLSWPLLDPGGTYQYVLNVFYDNATSPSRTIVLSNKTSGYIDSMPMGSTASYYVVAGIYTSASGVKTNTVTVTGLIASSFHMSPSDALFDSINQKVYVYGKNGIVAQYDLQSKSWQRHVSFDTSINYCDMGTYNGKTELYVPSDNGNLYIYDANTLTVTDQIYVGARVYSVAYSDGLLFISAGPANISTYQEQLITYDRATKAAVYQGPFSNYYRLKLKAGSACEFYAVLDYSEMYVLQYDNTGKFVGNNHYNYGSSGFSPVPYLFEVSPSGSMMITSNHGDIYDTSLNFIKTLNTSGFDFNSFCFGNTTHKIYATTQTTKQILGYDMATYALSNTIKTKGFPIKVFDNNGSVICVSSDSTIPMGYYSYYSGNLSIERF